MHSKWVRESSWLAVAAVSALSSPTFAQEAAPSATAATRIEDIVVTARKRDESILEVPVVVSTVTQEALEKYQISDFRAVANHMPGLAIGSASPGGGGGAQVSIRGIGTTAVNPTVDQAVALNLDGLALTLGGYAYEAALFDVGQIEVLKGPQALFFGKNSPAGVISLRSADPTDQAEIIARTGYEFEADEKVGEFILSGPVAPSLKMRLAARYSDQDGFFHNDVTPAAAGFGSLGQSRDSPETNWVVRGTTLFTPTDLYDARLKLNYTRQRLDGANGSGQNSYCPEGLATVNPFLPQFLDPADGCKRDRRISITRADPSAFPGVPNGGEAFVNTDQLFGSLEQNLHFENDILVTAVTGYYDVDQDTLAIIPGALTPLANEYSFTDREFTQELRLSTDFSDLPVNFTVGGFYQRGTAKPGVNVRGNTALLLPQYVQAGRQEVDTRSYSGFAQVRWKAMPTLELAAGGRYTHEERDHEQFNLQPSPFVPFPLGPLPLDDPKISASDFSPEITVTHTPTDDLTFFGSYKEGFKSGSFNTVSLNFPGAPASFGPERVKGGEVGMKARFLDGQMTVNLAGYYYKYDDLQVGATDVDGVAFAIRTLNAASAKVKGIDFDVAYIPPPAPGLTLRGAVNWNRARYGSFPNAPCGNGQTIAEGCDQNFSAATNQFTSQDLGGRPLVRAPNWAVNFGFDYETQVGNGLTLSLGSRTNYTSRYYTNLIDREGFVQKGYFKTDANIALKGAKNAWEVALIGTNLNNKITSGNCQNVNATEGIIFQGQQFGMATGGPAGEDEAQCYAERGRSVWLRFTLRPFELMQ